MDVLVHLRSLEELVACDECENKKRVGHARRARAQRTRAEAPHLTFGHFVVNSILAIRRGRSTPLDYSLQYRRHAGRVRTVSMYIRSINRSECCGPVSQSSSPSMLVTGL